MDKFGFIRGRRGPPGPPGKDALALDVWCTRALLLQFQTSATCLFYFNTETDGVLSEKKGLKDRNNDEKKNAIVIRGFNTPVKTKTGSYSLPLDVDSCYEIRHQRSAIKASSVFIVAFSFRLRAPIKDEFPYYIFSNTTSSRAVTLRKDWLDIAGCAKGSPQLKYVKDDWNTMIIQYSRMTTGGENDLCFFMLNGKRGSFQPIVYENNAHELYIGHKVKKTARIELNYFQVCERHFKNDGDRYLLPETFSTLLNEELQARVYDM